MLFKLLAPSTSVWTYLLTYLLKYWPV